MPRALYYYRRLLSSAPLSSKAVDTVVVGGGVVGLATARALARGGERTVLLETASALGAHSSGRSSGVIHAGLYYQKGSLKSTLCVRGKELLYAYCQSRGVPHKRLGKLVVAQAGQTEALHALRLRAAQAGVDDLELLTPAQAAAREPLVHAPGGALLSPSSGIVDVPALLAALRSDAEAAGADVLLSTRLVNASRLSAGGFELQLESGDGTAVLRTARVVNCAGLQAQEVARRFECIRLASIPTLFLARGNYFRARDGIAPFRSLVYPLPPPNGAGLGIHATVDLRGGLFFGPDVQPLERLDYRVDASRLSLFEAAIRSYLPSLPDNALTPAWAGIRPKLVDATARQPADFVLSGSAEHGLSGLLCLYGIESPGLTSCLALAELAVQRLRDGS